MDKKIGENPTHVLPKSYLDKEILAVKGWGFYLLLLVEMGSLGLW